MKAFKAAVRGPLKLEGLVEGKDLTFEMTLSATAELEERLGRSMKTYFDWVHLTAKDLPEVMRAGLLEYHRAEVDALSADINRVMYPELQTALLEAICAHAWPESTRIMAEALEKERERFRKGLPAPKNAPSVAVS